jgi:arsenate reductase
MAELGVDLRQEFPKPLPDEFVNAADVVITMGCGDACPIYPGKRYEDWEVDDPAGQSLDAVRLIRNDIDARVQHLLESLMPAGVRDKPNLKSLFDLQIDGLLACGAGRIES